ncbi:helix-turn-helix domain-containing protein [Ochrobactrum sp. A-1]|uniref:helix-turn-helix domain-containing protein n=1 Tax=Ochrobactrum sp. A-1 TaxID=2920940 RepID=UPI001F0B2C6C|nr:helix-turn-helix domain-containing protein [Ochrobactrum sp. A-1]
MAKATRTHLSGGSSPESELTPSYLTKEQFGRRVYQLMTAKGWRQAELARRSGLTRDAISTYVTGRSFPSPQNAAKLAEALGVTAEELLPNMVEEAIASAHPDFEFKTSAGDPTRAWIKIDRSVSLATAVKIAELIQADGNADD